MADGKVTISTALDLKGVMKDLGGLAKTVGKVASVMAAAFGVAAVAITTQSTEAFADWEQLTGGVETLFKGAADKVKQYAEDAFFSAGMSANEYMETVTGVSASLISSLGGDTEKAAHIANMAISDMADNANKMGTPLENVKTAYAGFAKQQYMLLDNLKLGYGGTKTEMQRLLKDAEAFSGVKYDINNLGDVYSAIHAIQEKLGITGATAAEAEKTITGSANMTKAAWKNVLTAIAGGGDLDKAINNLVYSVSKYFENIVPVVQRSLGGIGQMIEKIAPQLVQTVATSLIAAIPSLLNAIYQMIIGLAKGIYQGIIALFSGGSFSGAITKQLNNVSAGFSGAASGAEDLAEETEKAGKAAKKSLAGFDELNVLSDNSGGSGGADAAGTFGGGASVSTEVEVGGEVTDSVSPVLQVIFDKIQQMIEPLKNIDFGPLCEAFDKLKTSIEPFVKDLFDGLEWAWYNLLVPLADWTIEDLIPSFLDTLADVLDVLRGVVDKLKPLGQWLWDNFLQPLGEWTGGVIVDVITGIGDALVGISDWIAENQVLLEDIGIVIGSLAIAIGLVAAAWYSDAIASAVATVAMGAWNAICAVGTAVTTAFGAAMAALTSPITLVIAAIAAVISIVVLCIKHWDDIKAAAAAAWEWIKDLWESSCQLAKEGWEIVKGVWDTVATWFSENVVQPIANFFSDLWSSLKSGASKAWEGVKSVFSKVGKFFSDTFNAVKEKIVAVFQAGGTVFNNIKEGIVSVFKTVVNGIIKGLNTVIAAPFKGLNKILDTIHDVSIAGVEPFSWLTWRAPVPQIPLLAKGAVLPANKPFLAMVGDQKHGTNIEAPLATIQEAVALVMQDYAASNLAGQQATVAVLREILEAVLGISIGDDVIAGAVGRYQTRMAVVRGGQL